MADPTLDLLVRDPTHNRYLTVPTHADLALAEELLTKGDFVKVLSTGDRYLVRGLNDFEFLGNAAVDQGELATAPAFSGPGQINIGLLNSKDIANAATTQTIGQGVRIQGEGIAENDSGAVVTYPAGVPTLVLTTTDETAHSAVVALAAAATEEPWEPDVNGKLVLEAKLAIVGDLTEKRVYVGFIDTLALGSLTPATGSTTTITLTLDDQAGFLLDTGLTAATEWFLATNKADAAANQTAASASTGVVAVADAYQTLRVEIDALGNVAGYIDGALVKAVPLGIDPGAPVAPVVIVVSLDSDGIESIALQKLAFSAGQ